MKRKSILVVVLVSLIILLASKLSYGYSLIHRANNVSPKEILRIEEFLKENDGHLSENEKAKFSEIRDKMKRYEAISQEEFDYIRECERNIIRNKLGDVTFEEYSKLIKKRESKAEFTPPERFRLLEIEKQLKSIK